MRVGKSRKASRTQKGTSEHKAGNQGTGRTDRFSWVLRGMGSPARVLERGGKDKTNGKKMQKATVGKGKTTSTQKRQRKSEGRGKNTPSVTRGMREQTGGHVAEEVKNRLHPRRKGEKTPPQHPGPGTKRGGTELEGRGGGKGVQRNQQRGP